MVTFLGLKGHPPKYSTISLFSGDSFKTVIDIAQKSTDPLLYKFAMVFGSKFDLLKRGGWDGKKYGLNPKSFTIYINIAF